MCPYPTGLGHVRGLGWCGIERKGGMCRSTVRCVAVERVGEPIHHSMLMCPAGLVAGKSAAVHDAAGAGPRPGPRPAADILHLGSGLRQCQGTLATGMDGARVLCFCDAKLHDDHGFGIVPRPSLSGPALCKNRPILSHENAFQPFAAQYHLIVSRSGPHGFVVELNGSFLEVDARPLRDGGKLVSFAGMIYIHLPGSFVAASCSL
jgi:hypothetical protein